jgi:excisionase family DNA binding protein
LAKDAGREFLPLGAASRLIGVDPDTLRRWAADGRVDAFTTPGGHRRFERQSLERLIATRRPGRIRLSTLGATPDRLSRAYRRSYRTARDHATDGGIPDGDRDAFRRDGRRLVELLLVHLDTRDGTARDRVERDAEVLVDQLATRLAAAGTPLTESVALFVAARRPFLAELAAIGRRRSLDAARFAAAYEDASAVLDRLLLRLIESLAAARGDA